VISITRTEAFSILRSLEIGSDWFVLLLAVAVLSKYGSYLLLLGGSIRRSGIHVCDFARASAIVLLTARATMCLFAIAAVHERAFLIDVGRIVANLMTAVAVVPLFISLEKSVDATLSPDQVVKLFRLILVLFFGSLSVSGACYLVFR